MTKFTKYQGCYYGQRTVRDNKVTTDVYRAQVSVVHKDGTFTITALYKQDDQGKDIPGRLGYKYRVTADIIRAAS